jgi:hypothetical protein
MEGYIAEEGGMDCQLAGWKKVTTGGTERLPFSRVGNKLQL